MATLVRASLRIFSLSLACLVSAGCAPFDTTPRTSTRGTLGEEIYKIVCERMATEVWPTDVQGNQSRALCRGEAPPSAAPAGTRLHALAENRHRVVTALDEMLPEDLEDELQTMLLEMLPFYDPPIELLPNNTRAIGALLADLIANDEVMQAFGRISQRRGMHPQRNALGISRPILAYPGLPDLARSMLSVVNDGGPLEPEWSAVLEASALEMATSEPTAPDSTNLATTRDLLFRTHSAFGGSTPRYVAARDSRGLPIPTFIDGSRGFVDLDSDGLADADDLGRFLAADGSLLNPPTPFAVIGETDVTRDADGRAMTATDEPLYVYQDVEQTLLAALLRELSPLVDPADPVLVDMIYGLLPMLGADAAREEAYGSLMLPYDGFDTESGAFFDLVHAIGEVLRLDETPEALTAAQVLLTDHEKVIVPLIESGLFGDALGDQHPEIDLAPGSEVWDDVLQVATWMAEVPGLLEALLRSFNDPAAQRLGPIFAQMMLYKDVPQLNPADENEPLDYVYWSVPVDRTQPDAPGNMSLFQRTIAGIHELDGAQLCNKEGARAIVDLDVTGAALGLSQATIDFLKLGAGVLGLDWTDGLDLTAVGEWAGLDALGPWGECELLRIDNAARSFARAVIGREELVMNMGFITDLIDLLNLNSTVDAILPAISGIDGFDTTPTPQALARLMFGTPNAFINGLIDPPETIYGDVFRDRYAGNMVLAWERVFRFCGDRILDEGETCPTPIQEVTLYDALAPLITVLDDYDPLVDDDNDPNTPGRFLFAELVTAFHTHYATDANPMFQYTNPTGPRYVHPDRAVTYEPLIAALMSDCEWQPSLNAANRTCAIANSGRLITRLSRVTAALDEIQVGSGDGIDALAAALERSLNPEQNPGLANRAGATTTQTNQGSRTIPYSPIYLILDALNRMDDAHATDADRNERWLAARSRLVDTFIKTQPLANDQYQFENRRLSAAFPILLDFFLDKIEEHATAGDLDEWARSFDDDMADSLGGAMGSRTFRLLDAIHDHPETEQGLLELLRYLADESSPNDAFDNLLSSTAESLYIFEDDDTRITLIHALADAMAVGTTEAVKAGGTLDVEGAIFDQFIGFLDETNEVDTAHTFFTVLSNAVTHPSGEPETPIEVLADVIAEVNRATPNVGGPLEPDDHHAVMGQAEDFLTDDERGLERVFSIVQSRELN